MRKQGSSCLRSWGVPFFVFSSPLLLLLLLRVLQELSVRAMRVRTCALPSSTLSAQKLASAKHAMSLTRLGSTAPSTEAALGDGSGWPVVKAFREAPLVTLRYSCSRSQGETLRHRTPHCFRDSSSLDSTGGMESGTHSSPGSVCITQKKRGQTTGGASTPTGTIQIYRGVSRP